MPELPATTRQRMVDELGLTLDMASRIVNEPELQTFFHKAMKSPDPPQDAKIAANLLMIALPHILGDRPVKETLLKPGQLAELSNAKSRNELPHNIVLKLLEDLCESEYATAEDLILERRYRVTARDPERIRSVVFKVIEESPRGGIHQPLLRVDS
jgi:Asp-tRNA(Asn)/Glu-tRNA(Gln) amidotransferase B subunit